MSIQVGRSMSLAPIAQIHSTVLMAGQMKEKKNKKQIRWQTKADATLSTLQVGLQATAEVNRTSGEQKKFGYWNHILDGNLIYIISHLFHCFGNLFTAH